MSDKTKKEVSYATYLTAIQTALFCGYIIWAEDDELAINLNSPDGEWINKWTSLEDVARWLMNEADIFGYEKSSRADPSKKRKD